MIKNFFIYASVISLITFEAHALKLYLLSNHDHDEDHAQALGIGEAFESLSPEKVSIEDLNAKTLTSLEIKDKVKNDLSKDKVVCIGTGEEGIDGVKDLPKDPNLVTCLTSSTALVRYKDKDLLEHVDFIALPAHVSSSVKEELGEKLIETTGVSHNHRPDMTTYDEWQKELPPADVYLGVYLGGDTQTHTNEVKRFRKDDASRLANYVIAKAKEINQTGVKACILILNGPRTGKHDKNAKELLAVHREGRSDRVTEHFANKLADKGIEYKVFDFQHDISENKEWVSAYNAFDLVAGAVRTTKGKMIVPGENTFVVSEAIDIMPFDSINTMPPGKVLVYYNAAMNDIHIAHIESEKDAGRVSVLEDYQNIMPASETAEVKPSASRIIAQKLVKVTFEQAPWIVEDSLYRSTKKQESMEKSREDLVKRIRMEADKKANLTYGLIDR